MSDMERQETKKINNWRYAYLGIGSNLGDRESNLRKGIKILTDLDEVELECISNIYETEPWGGVQQDNFLNCVVKIRTIFSPQQLLAAAKEAERLLKRETIVRWGPRSLDVDILIFENCQINEETLTIPHPYMWQRAFVLVPLKDIAPEMIALGGQPLKEYLLKLNDIESVKFFDEGNILL